MNSRSGQTAVMMALSLTMIFGLFGFTADLGASYYQKQKAQGAAESAALAAATYAKANGVTCGTNGIACNSTLTSCSNISSGVLYVGCQYANQNGLPMSSISMAANLTTTASPPCSNCGSPTYWIQASISTTHNNLFLGGANIANPNINVQSVAGVKSAAGGTGTAPCIYVLSTNAVNAFDAGNAATVKTTNCGTWVNSNASPAMFITGGATLNSASINVVGSVTKNNGGSTTSVPNTGVAPVADPFAGLGVPTAPANNGACNYSGNYTAWQPSAYSLCPGTYSSGFSLGNGMSAQLASGIYVISGGPFSILNGGGSLTASGPVLIYLSGTQAYVNIANGAIVTLSALSTGQYQGVLFYQDRTVVSPLASTLAGGATMTLSGSLYFPRALVNINNGTNSQTGALVCGTVNFQGGANYTSGTQAQTGIAPSTTYTTGLIQ